MTRGFTADDYAGRLSRAAAQAAAAGLTGLLVTPGPDLLYLTGYAPIAITERITMPAIPASGRPAVTVTEDGGRRLNNTSRELRIVA